MIIYPKVAVVILNWNGKAYLQRFLPGVIGSSYPNLSVIVGDNASTDGSATFVKESFPGVLVIENDTNLGFAGGYNSVLKKVVADYYILLNSDVEVPTGWIEPVIEMMETDHAIAAAQPKLKDFNKRNSFEYAGAAGGFMDLYGYPFCRGRIFNTFEEDKGQYNVPSEVFWASGAALFIKRKYWEEAGGFDSEFFAHMEEIDLCWRLKNMGYKIAYCPSSEVYHIGGGTLQVENPYKTFLNYRNNLVMLLKNLPPRKRFPILFIRFWLDFISLLKFLLEGKFSHAKAINKAHTAFFRNLRANRAKITVIRNFNDNGLIKKCIVWQYFIRKKRTFKEIVG